jgi:hypothetical protein
MIQVILRGDAEIVFHRREKAGDMDMVDIWAHLEAIREGDLPAPCKAGKSCSQFMTTAQDAIYKIYYTSASSKLYWVDDIVQVLPGNRM